jgi:predicted Zn finger-like uncharacterized protein
MIIQCINCKKKFEVQSSLIPDTGRNIQCGSCNHTWFYKPINEIISKKIPETDKSDNNDQLIPIKQPIIDINKDKNTNDEIFINNKNISENDQIKKLSKTKKFFSLGKLLSYVIVSIISFISIIIILDTFKSSLNNIFPNLELVLYNLFETIKDIILFIKNLFI